MAISTMYPAKAGSPKTQLTAELSAVATSMTVSDPSALPDAPNLAVLGDDSSAEVVAYSGKSGSTITGLIRGLGGTTASVWHDGTDVARNFTSFDHDRFIENIEDLESNKLDSVSWGDILGTLADQTDLQGAFDLKANLASPALTGTPTAPTASVSTNDTQIATTAYVHKRGLLHVSITVAGSGNVKSYANENITATMRVVNCVFGTPANAPGKFTVVTAAGVITFTGTFTGSTTIDVDLMESDDVTATGV